MNVLFGLAASKLPVFGVIATYWLIVSLFGSTVLKRERHYESKLKGALQRSLQFSAHVQAEPCLYALALFPVELAVHPAWSVSW